MTAPTPRTPEMIKHMLSELEAPNEPLTDWEESFYESVSEQFTRRGTLSDKQFDILEKLYAEKTN